MRTHFRRTARLTDAVAFKRVFACPERFPGHGFVVLTRDNEHGGPRLGLAIAKRCASRAVDRNRLKRIARESFRLNVATLPAVDIVVLCGRGAPGIPNGRLRATLDQAWKTIRKQTWVASSSDSSAPTST